jgi:hypothetical protein
VITLQKPGVEVVGRTRWWCEKKKRCKGDGG